MTLMKPELPAAAVHQTAQVQSTEQRHYAHGPHKRRSRAALRVPKYRGTCAVCGDRANGVYFGALVCLPCKSFFIRCTKDDHSRFYCLGSESCNIQLGNRMRCQYCRFQKCIAVGMARKAKPETVQPAEGQELCRVCCDIANGLHFGVLTCEGCKKFFRRAMKEYLTYSCKWTKRCTINPRSRNACRYCRYYKCLNVGMSRSAIRMGRPKKTKKRLVLPSEAGHAPSYTLASDPSMTVNGAKVDRNRPYYLPCSPMQHAGGQQAVDGYAPHALTEAGTAGMAYWNPHMSPSSSTPSSCTGQGSYHHSPTALPTTITSPDGMVIKSEAPPSDCYSNHNGAVQNTVWRPLAGLRSTSDSAGTSCSSDDTDTGLGQRAGIYMDPGNYTFNDADVDALLQSLGDCPKWDIAQTLDHCMPSANHVVKQEVDVDMEEKSHTMSHNVTSPDSVFMEADGTLPAPHDNITILQTRRTNRIIDSQSRGLLEHFDESLLPTSSGCGMSSAHVTGRLMSLPTTDYSTDSMSCHSSARGSPTGPGGSPPLLQHHRGLLDTTLMRSSSLPTSLSEHCMPPHRNALVYMSAIPQTTACSPVAAHQPQSMMIQQTPGINNADTSDTDHSLAEIWSAACPHLNQTCSH